jgi:hypothetical protein
MSGGKTSDKQTDRHAGKQPGGEGSVVTSRDTVAADGDVHAPGHTHRKSMLLPEMSSAKQAGGKGETEKGNLAADALLQLWEPSPMTTGAELGRQAGRSC